MKAEKKVVNSKLGANILKALSLLLPVASFALSFLPFGNFISGVAIGITIAAGAIFGAAQSLLEGQPSTAFFKISFGLVFAVAGTLLGLAGIAPMWATGLAAGCASAFFTYSADTKLLNPKRKSILSSEPPAALVAGDGAATGHRHKSKKGKTQKASWYAVKRTAYTQGLRTDEAKAVVEAQTASHRTSPGSLTGTTSVSRHQSKHLRTKDAGHEIPESANSGRRHSK
jgi:hypothetical protein